MAINKRRALAASLFLALATVPTCGQESDVHVRGARIGGVRRRAGEGQTRGRDDVIRCLHWLANVQIRAHTPTRPHACLRCARTHARTLTD